MLLAVDHGHAIAFDRHGDEGAPAVMLLHGLSGARTTYDAVVRSLLAGPIASGGVQVVTADLRGHGESSHVSSDAYDAASYAADIAALVEHIDTGPVLLVGHSLGGVVAFSLAVTRPALVSRLLLEDPPLFEGDAERRAASPVAGFFPTFVAAVRELHGRYAPIGEYDDLLRATTPAESLRARAEGISRWDPATMEAAIDGTVWTAFDPTAPLACPVTVLRADPSCGAVFAPEDGPAFRAGNPQAEVVLIEGASHRIHDRVTIDAYLFHLDVAVSAFVATPR